MTLIFSCPFFLTPSISGKQLPMTVYSSKTQTVRTVLIEPSDSWGGQGLLGISIRFCSFEGANETVWHVLEVHPSSPAELAGLRSFTDYIIGADSVLHENEDLFALIEAHEGRNLKLYIYNSDDDACREVTITPNSKWGGNGSLGCGIGYGYLHRIPVRGVSVISALNNVIKSPLPVYGQNLSSPTIDVNVNVSYADNANVFAASEIPTHNVGFVPPTSDDNQNYHNENIVQETPLNSELGIASAASNINPYYQTAKNPNTTPNFPEQQTPTVAPTLNPHDTLTYEMSNVSTFHQVTTPPFSHTYTNVNYPTVPQSYTQTLTSTQLSQAPLIQQIPVMQSTQPPVVPSTYFQPYFHNPVYTSAPISQNTPTTHPLIYDPDIAARSAQLLLSSENKNS